MNSFINETALDRYNRSAQTRQRNKLIIELQSRAVNFPDDISHFLNWRAEDERLLSPDNHYIPAKETIKTMMEIFKRLIFK
jgi:hypothetical protein